MTPIVLGGLAVLAALCCGAARAESGPVPLARIALGELGGWIELPATLDGQGGRWLLDTGASRNLLSSELARRLRLPTRGTVRADTPLGPVQGSEVDLPALRIGALQRGGQSALSMDLRALFGAAAEGIDGVIGVPFLEGVQLDLDLRDDTSHWRLGGEADCPAGTGAVTLKRHRTLPVITLGTGAASESYVLDTGNPAGLIRVEADAADGATPGLALPGGMRLTVLPQATLGPQTRSDVPVTRLPAAALKKSFGDALRGLAGTGFIDGARWRLDLARDRLCVEPGRFATPGGFGLTLERQGAALQIGLVLPGSPAERAGLRADEIVTQWPGGTTTGPLTALWSAVRGVDEIVVGIGEPVRQVTLRRAIFAPAAAP